MTKRTRLWTMLGIMATALSLLPAFCPAQQKEEGPQTSTRLLTEERRQGKVKRQVGGVIQKLAWLIGDLNSNEFFQEGGGDKVARMNEGLVTINDQHVARAISHLKLARENPKNILPHVTAADQEVETILRDLDRLLKEGGLDLADDMLLAQLRAIIKAEEAVREQTAEWGKKMYVEPEQAKGERNNVSQSQETVRQQLKIFEQRLTEARDKETDEAVKERFTAACKVMTAKQPEAVLAGAADAIMKLKAVVAVEQQDRGLEILREMERLLAGSAADELAAMKKARDDLGKILKDEQSLNRRTAQANADQFRERQDSLQGEQREIGNNLEQAEANPAMNNFNDMKQNMDNALNAMRSAENALARGEQRNAATQEQNAIQNLQNMMDAIDRKISEMANPDGMQPSETAMNAEPGQEPGQEAGQEPGQEAGQEPGKSAMPNPNMMLSMTKGIKAGKTLRPGEPAKELDLTQDEGTSSREVKGDEVERTRMMVDALDRRKRDSVLQKYERELPAEFRQQVADYYEVLSEQK